MAGPTYHTSLITATDSRSHIHLILGSNPLAAARCSQSLGAGATPILIAPEPAEELHYGLQMRIDKGELAWRRKPFADDDLFTLGRDEVDGVVDAVFITTGGAASRRGGEEADRIAALCKRNRIPINVVDAPELCTFTLLSTHTDGPLQIGVTTNGRGCKLASRIRREVAAALPANLGQACARLGDVRRRILDEEARLIITSPPLSSQLPDGQQRASHPSLSSSPSGPSSSSSSSSSLDDSVEQPATFNRLVTDADTRTRRMRWLSQMCEYFPLKRLAALSDDDIENVLQSYSTSAAPASSPAATTTTTITTTTTTTTTSTTGPGFLLPPTTIATSSPSSSSSSSTSRARIILAGSGPGHPSLLTLATHNALRTADVVLADKLVPQAILDLIPRRTEVRIARKFPGNADAAQDEQQRQALEAFAAGRTVLRLKQGDPFLYGRGGEEVAAFRAAGVAPARIVVLPGLTSALAAPLLASVPPTQRDVADQVLVCTGTGKKGRAPEPAGWRAGRTVVFLMALHRIAALVAELTGYTAEEEKEKEEELKKVAVGQAAGGPGEDEGKGGGEEEEGEGRPPRSAVYRRRLWPTDTPCAVIERASCPDQRVIRTTLRHVVEAIEQEGSRPPGLLVVGKACEVLYTPEKGRSWLVEDGFKGLDLDDIVPQGLPVLE